MTINVFPEKKKRYKYISKEVIKYKQKNPFLFCFPSKIKTETSKLKYMISQLLYNNIKISEVFTIYDVLKLENKQKILANGLVNYYRNSKNENDKYKFNILNRVLENKDYALIVGVIRDLNKEEEKWIV